MKTKGRLRHAFTLLAILLYSPFISIAQESNDLYTQVYELPDKFFNTINDKSQKLQDRLNRSTDKYLKKLARRERKMYNAVAKEDSVAAREMFGDIDERYDSLQKALHTPSNQLQNVYSPHIDSMKTALSFLNQQKILSQSPKLQGRVQNVMKQYTGAQGKLNQTKLIQDQLKSRQELLKNKLHSFGMARRLKAYQASVYYYRAQMEEYKQVFENPKKLEARLIQQATKLPAFQKFFNQNSQLSTFFRLPGSDDDLAINDPSLQSRSMVLQDLQQRLGTGPNVDRYMSSSISNAQGGLDKAREKLNKLGSSGADMDMPDFKKNEEKTKSFLKRLEIGTNIQSTKSNSFFPATTDVGMSVGYKLNQKSAAGVGVSYKLGWGSDIRHVRMSNEGVGLRSYMDIKIKGSFFASGGLEYNYQQPFSSVRSLYQADEWTESGLIGIAKIVSVKSKTFKKTKFQLLFDFLSLNAVPQRQHFIFRANYGLK